MKLWSYTTQVATQLLKGLTAARSALVKAAVRASKGLMRCSLWVSEKLLAPASPAYEMSFSLFWPMHSRPWSRLTLSLPVKKEKATGTGTREGFRNATLTPVLIRRSESTKGIHYPKRAMLSPSASFLYSLIMVLDLVVLSPSWILYSIRKTSKTSDLCFLISPSTSLLIIKNRNCNWMKGGGYCEEFIRKCWTPLFILFIPDQP